MSEDAGLEPRTVFVTLALTVRLSNHSAASHPSTRLPYTESLSQTNNILYVCHVYFRLFIMIFKSFIGIYHPLHCKKG